MIQPDLTDEFGVPFYGEAETITGYFWWYTDAHGVRHALMPAVVGTTILVKDKHDP